MYNIKGKKAEKIEAVTFSDLGMQENDIEEILRCSVDMLCDDEDSMLIVGRQVKNDKLGRSDLTAVDNNGNIVLIETINRWLNNTCYGYFSFCFPTFQLFLC